MSDDRGTADEAQVEALARAAGVELAFAHHRSDLVAAFLMAQRFRAALRRPEGPGDEPWPDMQPFDDR